MGTLKVDDIFDESSKQYFPARVSGTLNGSGTISLQANLNVSSATDNGTGKYQFNFSNSLISATYFASGSCCYQVSSSGYQNYLSNRYTGGNQDVDRTSSACKVGSYDGSYTDTVEIGFIAVDAA
jgi:hypothetical protein